ncbi:hypothetical protein M569_05511 [Genlisea aurea]|uniref:J domain-containing protein n=1 Tax=Genlisea aurea TaxID=192259 RepID=S8E0N3_9LAMI|nr:hypothetical protein M569_05511 [Genlisea aurea]
MEEPSRTQTQNYYRILGIPKSATLSDICKAYKALVIKWHPDRNQSNKDEAEANFRSINEAYRVAMPIFYSQSAVRRKPQPIEKKLECSLEELCNGCIKKIKITRDSISSSGLLVQEDEILMIKVKPGWKRGTKITFEGKGDERPGALPADIIFSIEEKQHPLFKREGDDLELGVEVPLVQALTGCTVPVPLLGGGEITLSIDDIIYPGYEKTIPGEGMPKPKEGRRGDLRLKFLVDFQTELRDEQRQEVVRILEGSS